MEFMGFPVEIQVMILESLCLHCQMARRATSIPNLETRRARANKHALSQLCLASRYLMSLAQPILYHYFSSDHTWDNSMRATIRPEQFRGFIQTIQTRSDLATQVKLLTVQHLTAYEDVIESAAPLISSYPADGVYALLHRATMDIVSDKLPNLEYLRYEKMVEGIRIPDLVPTKPLPNVRVLEHIFAFASQPLISDFEAEMRCFPKLEAWNLLERENIDEPNNELSLSPRRVQLDALHHWQIVSFTKHLPQLEDLDVLLDPCDLEPHDLTDPSYQIPLLGRAGHKLRRLAWSMALTPMPPFQLEGLFDLTLHSLGALQVLQIDQTLLHMQLKQNLLDQHDALSQILPPQLVKLHVTGIRLWPHMRRQLDDLVLQRAKDGCDT